MAKIKIKSKGAIHQMITAKRGSDDRRPGSLPDDLRGRLPDVLANDFSQVGEDLYDKTMAEVSESVKRNFADGIESLRKTVTTETGKQGYEKSKRFIHEWLRGIVNDIQTKGVSGLSDSLGSLASDFSVQYKETPEETKQPAAEGEELLEVEAPKVEPEKTEQPEQPEEDVTDADLTAILEGKDVAPAEVKVETAAGTMSEVKRRLRATRSQRRIQAHGQTREELLRAAAVHLTELDA